MTGLFIINSLEGGGAERVFSQLLSLISENDDINHLEVVLLDRKPIVYELPDSLIVHQLNSESILSMIWDFHSIVRKSKPDFALSFLTRANFFNIYFSFFYGYKSIISERSNTSGRLSGKYAFIKRFITKITYRRAHCIISVSKGVKNGLVNEYGINPDNVHILHNPVNSDKIKAEAKTCDSNKDQSKAIIAIGRLVNSKGFDTLLRAYSLAKLPVELKILGQGPMICELKKLAEDLSISTKVTFCGFQKNPYIHIRSSLFFILPSRLEGFPNALLEAMALGKAVIATNCADGPSEILGENGNIATKSYIAAKYGLMTNVDDEIGMADALKAFCIDDNLREEYEALSLERVKHYSTKNFYERFVEILNLCL